MDSKKDNKSKMVEKISNILLKLSMISHIYLILIILSLIAGIILMYLGYLNLATLFMWLCFVLVCIPSIIILIWFFLLVKDEVSARIHLMKKK